MYVKTIHDLAHETYHGINGERVVIEARRFGKPHEISGKNSRHGASRVKADKAKLG